ncbi:MAG: TIGR01777 family oxidoreductase [Sphingobacteriaceae bacterium]
MNKTVLVTGGTGLIGQALCQELLNKGYNIHLLSRKAKPQADSRIKTFVWNVEKGVIDEDCIQGVESIIHLAGEGIVDKRWTAKRKQDIINSRTESIRLIYQLIKNTPSAEVKSIISAAAIGFYADRGDELLTEESPAGWGFLAESCIAWENAVDEGKALSLRIVKFRTGIVLDPQGGALKEIARPVKFGLGAALGSGKQWVSWIHKDDVVNMYLFALENESLSGVFNMAAPHPVTNSEMTQAIARQFHKPLFLPAVPAFALRLAMGEMSAAVLGSTRVTVQKIENAGFKFAFADLEPALKNLYA